MKAVCITLTDHRYGKAAPHQDYHSHLAERGLDVQMYYGIHAQRIGVNAVVPSAVIAEVDPDKTQSVGMIPTGIWLSHRALWGALLLLPDDSFLILEDDAKFPENWRERFDAALRDVPDDWDILFVGSCCTSPQRKLVRGEIYEDARPQCTHAYCVRRKALLPLCELADEIGVREPVDGMIARHASSRLRVYTVLPRIADQFDTILPE